MVNYIQARFSLTSKFILKEVIGCAINQKRGCLIKLYCDKWLSVIHGSFFFNMAPVDRRACCFSLLTSCQSTRYTHHFNSLMLVVFTYMRHYEKGLRMICRRRYLTLFILKLKILIICDDLQVLDAYWFMPTEKRKLWSLI